MTFLGLTSLYTKPSQGEGTKAVALERKRRTKLDRPHPIFLLNAALGCWVK